QARHAAVLELHFSLAIAACNHLHTRQQGQVYLCGHALGVARWVDRDRTLNKGQTRGAGRRRPVGMCGNLKAKDRKAKSEGKQRGTLEAGSRADHLDASVKPSSEVPPPLFLALKRLKQRGRRGYRT